MILLQVQESLEASKEQCRELEAQLQKRETALLAAQSKTDQLTSDLQNKVFGVPSVCVCVSNEVSILLKVYSFHGHHKINMFFITLWRNLVFMANICACGFSVVK